jgi:NAD+ dependent glucose-6-phosphate dehydrogenase
MTAKRVLITGVYGLIASAVYRRLTAMPERYEVYALARRAEPSERATSTPLEIPKDRFFLTDMSDLSGVEKAFSGMDTVVHMAADPRPDAHWDSLLQSNIVGARNAFEAAVRTGVHRVVYASSIMVSWGYQSDEPYKALSEGRFDDLAQEVHTVTHEWPPRPTGLYPATKVWGEALARYNADVHGLSSLCLRIGWVNAEDHPHRPESGAVWCSQRDVVQLVEKSIEAPEHLKFGIYYGVSNNKWRWVDIDHAREVLGYIPQDSAEDKLEG